MRLTLVASGGYVLECRSMRAMALCMLAVACGGGRLPRATYTPQATSALVAVTLPPPPARVELVPASPSPRAVWVDGEWIWRRERWAWMPGRWVEAAPGSTFAPWVFVRGTDGGLWYAPGAWHDAKGAPVDAPVSLSIATVEGGGVVDAEGASGTTGPNVRPGRVRAAQPAQ